MKRISKQIAIERAGQFTSLDLQVPHRGRFRRAIVSASPKGERLYPTFFGTGPEGLGQAAIRAMESRLVPPGRQEWRFSPVMERFYFAFPAAFGQLLAIFDENGYEMLAAFRERTEDFEMAGGLMVPYRIYESRDDTSQNHFLLKFIF